MSSIINQLPIQETLEPSTIEEIQASILNAREQETAIYPLGGQTSLDYGMPAKQSGTGLSMAKLNQLVDFPARDMTVTVQAGMTMDQLKTILAAENQELPIDVPCSDQAQIGGVIATGWNGPRRLGMGTIRDYVIGIEAVSGLGKVFHGGGRVVKNVAGFDFCKLLTGSLGTLGIITQVTLKVRPKSTDQKMIVLADNRPEKIEEVLESLASSEVTPSAVELLQGPQIASMECLNLLSINDQQSVLAVLLSGTSTEVDWMESTLSAELSQLQAQQVSSLDQQQSDLLWERLVEFPANQANENVSPLVLKASLRSSQVVSFCELVRQLDHNADIVSHALNGIVHIRMSEIPGIGIANLLSSHLLPAVSSSGGNVCVISNPGNQECTHQLTWGGLGVPYDLMNDVKQQFDPDNVLNPGRFVYR
ncbi:MAG: hypothetical protein COA78_03650 [Blastopirellula sp.]|nr:MAG: hypothetical protein COA78_03650 [Blastopirellula sp.]